VLTGLRDGRDVTFNVEIGRAQTRR
jgi:hypothetical protein